MTTATVQETDRLAALVEKKHECLVSLRDLGEKQLEYVRDGTMSALLELLAYKQKVITLLQRIERAIDPYRGQTPESREWSSEEKRLACSRTIDKCQTLLDEIMQQEKQSETEMVIRRDTAARELQGMNVAGQVSNAYAQHSNRSRGKPHQSVE